MQRQQQSDGIDLVFELMEKAAEHWPVTLALAAALAVYIIMPASFGFFRTFIALLVALLGITYNAIIQHQKQQKKNEAHWRQRQESLAQVWAEIDSLTGLAPVKEFLREVEAVVRANMVRQQKGLPPLKQSLHMMFTGNPGTGKTTVARLVGKLLAAMGALPSGHLVETDRSGLVGQYVGQTAPKTWEMVGKAMGGVLFVDEAYALAGGKGSQYDFGSEALAVLIKAMEDYRDRLVVILAGYTQEMKELYELNPGLESRVAFTCEFPDYSPEELVEIAMMEIQKQGFSAAPGVEEELYWRFRSLGRGIGAAGNGRYARKLVEQAIRKAVVAGRVDVLEAGDFA
ncbi:MAG: AAA family ATPase [Pelotomaculum sp.]|nr:AAA family ATPase [Pelotomaculum sp.]